MQSRFQELVFTRWMNSRLSLIPDGERKVEVLTELSDGVLLVYLLEMLSFEELTKGATFCRKPTLGTQKVANVAIVFQFLQENQISVEKCSPQDVCNSNLPAIQELVWALIKKYQISATLKQIGCDVEVTDEENIKGHLLDWCRLCVGENIHILDFSTSFCDGKVFCAMIEHFNHSILQSNEITQKTVKYVMQTALELLTHYFGVPQFINFNDPTENKSGNEEIDELNLIISPPVDERSMMTMVSAAILSFQQYAERNGQPKILLGNRNSNFPSFFLKLSADDQSDGKDETLRKNVIKEIHSTEMIYLHNLQLAIDHYKTPLMNVATNKDSNVIPFITEQQVNNIFSSLEIIYNLNKVICSDLEQALADTSPALGHVFKKMAPGMKLYASYITHYDRAISELEACLKNPVFKSFLEECRADNELALDLGSYLIMPVQRLPRYQMLLQELLKRTNPNDSDYPNICDALAAVKDVNKHINERRRDGERRNRIVELAKIIKMPTDNELVKPNRVYIQEGPMKDKKENWIYVFLFNDMLLATTKRGLGRAGYSFSFSIPLYKATLSNLPSPAASVDAPTQYGFQISTQQGNEGDSSIPANGDDLYIFYTASEEEEKSWLASLEEWIVQCKNRNMFLADNDDAQAESSDSPRSPPSLFDHPLATQSEDLPHLTPKATAIQEENDIIQFEETISSNKTAEVPPTTAIPLKEKDTQTQSPPKNEPSTETTPLLNKTESSPTDIPQSQDSCPCSLL